MTTHIKVGIIGGSGLDNPDILKNRSEKKVTTMFGNPSDVLIEGFIGNVRCVLLARHGRKHDIMPGDVNYRANIWAMKEACCTHLVVSTATGSLQEEIRPGDLVVLDSFIDRTHGRKQSFFDGQPGHPVGVCHLPMEPAFCERLRQLVIETCAEMPDLTVHRNGTVVAIEGPRFSSVAESKMHRMWGGHVVNMTSVPEVNLAKEAGLCYVAIALATDYDCWRTTGEKVSVAKVLETFKDNVTKITRVIEAVVPKIANENWDDTIKELKELVTCSTMLPTPPKPKASVITDCVCGK